MHRRCNVRPSHSLRPSILLKSTYRYIPPGTSMWVHAYSMHRHPRHFFPRPEEFWPERWLLAAQGPKAALATELLHDEGAFIPFSHGPLNCVGKSLALQELKTVVCALMQRFRIRRADAEAQCEREWMGRYETSYRDFFVSIRGRVDVVLEPRPQTIRA